MKTATKFQPTAAPLRLLAAAPTSEAFAVRMGYIWLMVTAPSAGLITALLGLIDGTKPPLLALTAALLALGYWGWRQGYRKVQLELRPDSLRIQPTAPGQPAENLPLARIANYLRPQESYYQLFELQLYDGQKRRFSKRLRPAGALLTLEDWTETLIARLEQSRPAAVPAEAAVPLAASGLVASRPRIFARTVWGKILAGLAVVWLLLALLALVGPGHVPSAVFVVPSIYLAYYSRARGALKAETTVLTGAAAARENAKDQDDWPRNNWQNS